MAKKWLVLLAALVMMLTVLVGCGEEPPVTEAPSDETGVSKDEGQADSAKPSQTVGAVKLTDQGAVVNDPDFTSGGILTVDGEGGVCLRSIPTMSM